jgi:hypothetical protein
MWQEEGIGHLRGSHGKQLGPPSVGHETGAEGKDGCKGLHQAEPLERSLGIIQSIDGRDEKVWNKEDGDDFGGV